MFVAVLVAESVERVLARPGLVGEDRGVDRVGALLELAKELKRNPLGSSRKRHANGDFVRFRIDGCEDPIA